MQRAFQSATLLGCCIGMAVIFRPLCWPTTMESSRRQVAAAVAERNEPALALARSHVVRFGQDWMGIALAAEAAVQAGDHAQAMEWYERLPRDQGRWEFQRELGIGRRCEVLGRLSDAERHYRRALALSPYDMVASERLGHLLQISGRTWESAPYFSLQIARGKCRGDELMGMATTERFFRSDERLDALGRGAARSEPLLQLGEARRLLFDNQSQDAEELLRASIRQRPELGEAQGRLGRIIVDRGDLQEFVLWRGGLSVEVLNHPEVWYAQGLQARRLGQIAGACRCFLETLQRSPSHLGANVQLAGCLEQAGQAQSAKDFAGRAEVLTELESNLNLMRGNSDRALIRKAVGILADLGRYWEAAGWCYVLTQLDPDDAAAVREFVRWRSLATSNFRAQDPDKLPGRMLNTDDFPLPFWPVDVSPALRVNDAADSPRNLRLVDRAEDVGIEFRYFEGTTEETRLEHIFNTMGAGMGVLDYDLDGWPDLYLAQAYNWRDPASASRPFDPLFRNRLGQRFDEATTFARLAEDGFTHGIAVGDIDQDGFPDIYAGNMGPNTLYRNQGDGTFQNVSVDSGTSGREWTTSSVIADLNADGLPDLYVLNYADQEETARKDCFRTTGERMACTPDVLISAADRLYLNRGDGTFADISDASGIASAAGKGLGVVVWDYTNDGRLGVFVANDTTPNFLWLPEGIDPQGIPRFREDGVVRGIAFDVDGNAQASMGVAAADANGDGQIDLFITNFFGDSNTLYSQQPDGFFNDLTRPFGLRDAGFWMLGFGCQFADLDGDGWSDLVATNGHVDQLSSKGTPDRMPPQVFRNERGKRFYQLPVSSLGPFFAGQYLGRGLATVDWNRDGQVDFAVSHLHAPFALVTNESARNPNHDPLVLGLVGRTGCRDPVGARIRVFAGEWQQERLVTAGDGFLVSNERRWHVAVPREISDVSIEIRWPAGPSQLLEGVKSNQEVRVVEGLAEPIVLRVFGVAHSAAD